MELKQYSTLLRLSPLQSPLCSFSVVGQEEKKGFWFYSSLSITRGSEFVWSSQGSHDVDQHCSKHCRGETSSFSTHHKMILPSFYGVGILLTPISQMWELSHREVK